MSHKRARKTKLVWDNLQDLRACIVSEELLSNNQASISGMEKEEENEIDLRKAADAQANQLMHEILTPQVNFCEDLVFKKKHFTNRSSVQYSNKEEATIPLSYKIMANTYSLDLEDVFFCKENNIPFFYLAWFVTFSFHGPMERDINKQFYNFVGMSYSHYAALDEYIEEKLEKIKTSVGVSTELLPFIDRFRHLSCNNSYGCFYPRPPKVATRRKVQGEIKALEHAYDMRYNVDGMRIVAAHILVRQEIDKQEAVALCDIIGYPSLESMILRKPEFVSYDERILPRCLFIRKRFKKPNRKLIVPAKPSLPERTPELRNIIGGIVYRMLDQLSRPRPHFINVVNYENALYPCPTPFDVYGLKLLLAISENFCKPFVKEGNRNLEPPDFFEKDKTNFIEKLAGYILNGLSLVVYDSRQSNFKTLLPKIKKSSNNGPDQVIYIRLGHLEQCIDDYGPSVLLLSKFNRLFHHGQHIVQENIASDSWKPVVSSRFCEIKTSDIIEQLTNIEIDCGNDTLAKLPVGGNCEKLIPYRYNGKVKITPELISAGIQYIQKGYSSKLKFGVKTDLVQNRDYEASKMHVVYWKPHGEYTQTTGSNSLLPSVVRLKNLLKSHRNITPVFPGYQNGPNSVASDENLRIMRLQLSEALLAPFAEPENNKTNEHHVTVKNSTKDLVVPETCENETQNFFVNDSALKKSAYKRRTALTASP